MMEFSEQDKAVLRMAAEHIWRKGVHAPQEAMLATAFGQIVEKIHAPKALENLPPKEKIKDVPCSTDAKEQKS